MFGPQSETSSREQMPDCNMKDDSRRYEYFADFWHVS